MDFHCKRSSHPSLLLWTRDCVCLLPTDHISPFRAISMNQVTEVVFLWKSPGLQWFWPPKSSIFSGFPKGFLNHVVISCRFPPFSNPEKNQGFQGWRLDGQIYRLQVAARRAFQVGQAFDKVWRRNAQKQLPWIGLRENLQGKSPYFNIF